MFINIFNSLDLFDKIEYQYSRFENETDERYKLYLFCDILLSLNHLPEWIILDQNIPRDIKELCLKKFNPYKDKPEFPKNKKNDKLIFELLREFTPYSYSFEQDLIRDIANSYKHFKISSREPFLHNYQEGFNGFPSNDNFGSDSVLNAAYVIEKHKYMVKTEKGNVDLQKLVSEHIKKWRVFINETNNFKEVGHSI